MRYQAGSYSTGKHGLDSHHKKENWEGSIQANSVLRVGTTSSYRSRHQVYQTGSWQLTVCPVSFPQYTHKPHLRSKTEDSYFTCGQIDRQRGTGLPASCLLCPSPGFLPISHCVNSTDSEASHPEDLLGNQRKWQGAHST